MLRMPGLFVKSPQVQPVRMTSPVMTQTVKSLTRSNAAYVVRPTRRISLIGLQGFERGWVPSGAPMLQNAGQLNAAAQLPAGKRNGGHAMHALSVSALTLMGASCLPSIALADAVIRQAPIDSAPLAIAIGLGTLVAYVATAGAFFTAAFTIGYGVSEIYEFGAARMRALSGRGGGQVDASEMQNPRGRS